MADAQPVCCRQLLDPDGCLFIKAYLNHPSRIPAAIHAAGIATTNARQLVLRRGSQTLYLCRIREISQFNDIGRPLRSVAHGLRDMLTGKMIWQTHVGLQVVKN
ncbi:MAG TPA: hypothetical protein VGD30_16385 [Telluria sp.]